MTLGYAFIKPLAAFLLLVAFTIVCWLLFNWYNSPDFEVSSLKHGSVIKFENGINEVNAKKGKLTVLSYNLGFAAGPMQETLADDHPESFYTNNLDKFIELVKSKDVDILLLQEVDLDSKRSSYMDQLEYIMDRLGWGYAAPVVDWDLYFPFRKEHKIVKATVVLSKFPISSNDYTLTSCKPNFDNKLLNIFYYPLLWKSTMQRVSILVEDNPIDIYNVHLCVWNRAARVEQIKSLSKWINEKSSDRAFLVAGDFNFQAYIRGTPIPFADMSEPSFMKHLWDQVPEISELYSSKSSDAKSIHNYFTFPERRHRYDFMYYSKKVHFLDSNIIQDIDSSDHLPLIATFKLK
ncbi:endonuclease/exonuclease/phosphatase family protein [Maridesulfovibrio frigidus]|uniref:endonuclease/exonuclease/phosphatase family protein n=1 Tax=Maridesulfovibrio frigidus TaxID=340956 RepID=UPI0004E19DDC|nr:endonuclease/exonuclease/phosphatase family protein [Maridesulfovibrio frigidus]